MDVSEFLRFNAKESSLHMKSQSRSAGDGAESVHTSPSVDAIESKNKDSSTPNSISMSKDVDLSKMKNLIPYKIESGSPSEQSKKFKTKPKPGKIMMEIINERISSKSPLPTHCQLVKSVSSDSVPSTSCAVPDSFSSIPVMSKVNELADKLSKKCVMTPPDYDMLNSPSVDVDTKLLISITPKPKGVPTSKHSSIKYQQIKRKTYKEPRFIPYEPYKGCVVPLVKPSKKNHPKSEVVESPAAAVVEDENTLDAQDKKARAKLETVVCDFEKEKLQWEQRVQELTAKCDKLQQEKTETDREKVKLEDQLNIQAQVNGELKKLLVASVGEDVQGRVHCLTEDKARMATIIRRYSDKLDRDYEERERMEIQCDVWKSKFMASSVLVEELGAWKAGLLRWTAEAAESISTLLEEQKLMRSNLRRAYRLMCQLVRAFDPLYAEGGSSAFVSGDGVSLSLAAVDQAHGLHQRLLGPLLPAPAGTDQQLCIGEDALSPGEKMGQQVLERRESSLGCYLSDCTPLHSVTNTINSHKSISCCKHCNGEMQVV